MRLLTLLLVTAAAAMAFAAPAEAGLRQCPDYGGSHSVTQVTAAQATCKTARRIIRKQLNGDGKHAGHFTCKTKKAPAPAGSVVTNCYASGQRVIGWHAIRPS